MDTKKETIILRLSTEDKKHIHKNMLTCQIPSMSEYIRQMALNGCILEVDHSDIKRYIYELNRIGNNINQLAKKANETGSIYVSDIKELQILMEGVWQLLKSSQYIHL